MNLDDIFKSTGEGTETKIEHMCPFMKGLPPPKQNTPHFRNSDKVTGNMQGIERRSKNRSPHTLKQSAFPPNFAFLNLSIREVAGYRTSPHGFKNRQPLTPQTQISQRQEH